MRPPGYEPGELPTAPPRDMWYNAFPREKPSLSLLRVQRYDIIWTPQKKSVTFLVFLCKKLWKCRFFLSFAKATR